MSEPTIDEMLEYLEDTSPRPEDGPDDWIDEFNAICAILELHRLPAFTQGMEDALKQLELKAIRAFVKRLSERMEDSGIPLAFFVAAHEELAAMEKEADPTNPGHPDFGEYYSDWSEDGKETE